MKNNSRKKAVHALLLVNRLKEIIEKIDRGSDIEHFFDSIENTTIKLGNTIKEIAKKNRTFFDKKTEATLYNLRCEFAHQTGSENYNHKEGYNLWKKKSTWHFLL